jgi:hypothetical protein
MAWASPGVAPRSSTICRCWHGIAGPSSRFGPGSRTRPAAHGPEAGVRTTEAPVSTADVRHRSAPGTHQPLRRSRGPVRRVRPGPDSHSLAPAQQPRAAPAGSRRLPTGPGDLRSEKPRQSPPELSIDAPLGQQRPEPVLGLVRKVLIRPVGIGTDHRLQADVVILDQQPSPGPQRRGHPPLRLLALGYVEEDEPGVDEIEPVAWRLVVSHVVLRTSTSGPPTRSANHPISISVATTRPLGPTRAAGPAGTEGPPAPTSQHRQPAVIPQGVDVVKRHRVEDRRERVEASTRLGGTVVQ